MICMKHEKLYSVKEVLELCHVTRKQLLYYEEKGLITAVRDENNNYRYYTEHEMFKVDFILGCRENGFSLQSVKNMLDNRDVKTLRATIKQAMRDTKEEFARSVQKYERSMERYNTMLEASHYIGNNCDAEIEIVDIPERNIIFLDFDGYFVDDMVSFYSYYSKLDTIRFKYNFTKISTRMIQFFDCFDSKTGNFDNKKHKIRMFYEVRENMPDCPHFDKAEACKALSVIATGSYDESFTKVYKKIIDYANENDIELAPVSIEEVMLEPSFDTYSPELCCTRVFILIK